MSRGVRHLGERRWRPPQGAPGPAPAWTVPHRFGYRVRGLRAMRMASLALLALLALPAFLEARTRAEADMAFGAGLSVLAVVWAALLWWFGRAASEISVEGGRTLRWRVPRGGGGEAPIDSVAAVSLRSSTLQVRLRDGRTIEMAAQRGVLVFIDAVAAAAPDVDVELGWYGRLAGSLPSLRPGYFEEP